MLQVRKFSGDLVPFEADKLLKSLLKSGASPREAQFIFDQVIKSVDEGTSTKLIYKIAHRELKKMSGAHATRYNIKQGLLALGPTGYVFEQFIARLFAQMGFKVQTNIIVKGACVSHEIDVFLEKDAHQGFIECKFSNRDNAKVDVKVPLYVKARWDDVRQCTLADNNTVKMAYSSCWLVSNQRFSADAKNYAACIGMQWLGWDKDAANSLAFYVDKFKTYPITSLTTLTQAEKMKAIEARIICVQDVVSNWVIFDKMKLSKSRLRKLEDEIHALLKTSL